MLLDRYFPHHDFREIHAVPTCASSQAVLHALRKITPADVPLVRTLMGIRSLPALLFGGAPFRSKRHTPFLDQIIGSGFLLLEETKNEVLLGTIGKFWRPSGGLCPEILAAEEFRSFAEPGWAKVGWNFVVEGEGDNRRIRTETRICCTDESSRTLFGFYWWIVRPGSGMIRKSILRALKQQAEKEPGR
jgi:hypothetical protein